MSLDNFGAGKKEIAHHPMLQVTFFGVRGSTPCSGPETQRYGGNTSCVLVQVPGERPIICDLGTGVRYLGLEHAGDEPFRGVALISHLHWDHIQGLPFFAPVLSDGAELEVVGPPQHEDSLSVCLAAGVAPPLFPVPLGQLPGTVRCRETSEEVFCVDSATVTVFPITHVGPTNGYRIDHGLGSVAYISDFQEPEDGSMAVNGHVAEVCRDVDILIHDAQYDRAEFAAKADWGHCTVEYAVSVATEVGAKRLVLYHHDPMHDDGWVDEAVESAIDLAGGRCEVLAAAEGMTLGSGERSAPE